MGAGRPPVPASAPPARATRRAAERAAGRHAHLLARAPRAPRTRTGPTRPGCAGRGAGARAGPSSGSGPSADRDAGRVRREVERAAGVAGSWNSALAGAPRDAQDERVGLGAPGPRAPRRARTAARACERSPRVDLLDPGIARAARNSSRWAQSYGGRNASRRRVSPRGGAASRRSRRSTLGARSYVFRNASLNRRRLPKPAASAISVMGRSVSSMQPLREVQPARLGDGDRGGADVVHEQAVEVARADAEPRGERVDRRSVERAVVHERERAPHHRRRAEPGRGAGRRLGPAAQARPVARPRPPRPPLAK